MGDARGVFRRLALASSRISQIALVLIIFFAAALHAQTFGEVTGLVTDTSGAVMAGASVTLVNVNTNGVRQAVSTSAGLYSFPSVPPGHYKLSTVASGFKSTISEMFQVQV